MTDTLPFYIEGERHSDQTIDVTDKYTGDTIARVSVCEESDVDLAYNVASKAKPIPFHKRADILDKASVIVSNRKRELAETICSEAGKPIKLADGEVDRCAQTLKISASVARTLKGETINFPAHPGGVNRRGYVSYEPVGTVCAISPFNFPLNLITHKIAPAISAGCPVVAKPASKTPISALKLAEILYEAGLPQEHLSVLIGSGPTIGKFIASHGECKHISFTGSPDVGWGLVKINPYAGRTLELGSNSAMIADGSWEVADIARKAVTASMAYSGQVCISLQTLYITVDIFDDVCDAVISEVEQLKIGDPHNPEFKIGPMISENEADRVRNWIEKATTEGGELLYGADQDKTMLGPHIMTFVPETSSIVSKEVFGPVLTINSVDSLDDAVSRINKSSYAINTGVLVSDYRKALRVSESLDVAGVIIGDSPIFRTDQMPYGGIKGSGIGREGPSWAVRDLVREKLTVFTL